MIFRIVIVGHKIRIIKGVIRLDWLIPQELYFRATYIHSWKRKESAKLADLVILPCNLFFLF